MNAINESKKCYNCAMYCAYYKKGYLFFDKLDYGKCRRTGEISQDKHGTCNEFRQKTRHSISRKDRALLALTQAADSINEITQILLDDEQK